MELGLADLGDDGGIGCGAIGDLRLVRRSAVTAMDCNLLAIPFVSVECKPEFAGWTLFRLQQQGMNSAISILEKAGKWQLSLQTFSSM